MVSLYQKCIEDGRIELLSEWDTEKNAPVAPWTVSPGSHQRIWWKCKEGHSWQAAVFTRWDGHGCPYCSGRSVEKGVNDLESCNRALAEEWNTKKNGDLKPADVSLGSSRSVWWQCEKGHEWKASVASRSGGKGCPYCGNRKLLPGFNDLATANPELAKEWHPEKNGKLTPNQVFPGSPRRVWWQCEKGHEWQAAISSRAKKGCECPYCSGKLVLPGFNDLLTVAPEIAAQWHPTKNDGLTPENVHAHSMRSIWWQCGEGHAWKATVVSRVKNNASCPICANKAILVGVNDLATVAPEIAAQWHPTKNGELTPQQIGIGSHLRVWWKCKKGHEWRAQIMSRKNRNSGCPVCAGRSVVLGVNDLETFAPAVAAQWHPTKNNGLTPDRVRPQSNRTVWWLCEKGHEWRAEIKSRTGRGSGCPYCSGHMLLVGFNDLATTEPRIAAQWDYELNGELTPQMVMAGSHKKVWWHCSQGHFWQALVFARTGTLKTGCPVCAGKVSKKRLARMKELEDTARANIANYRRLQPERFDHSNHAQTTQITRESAI